MELRGYIRLVLEQHDLDRIPPFEEIWTECLRNTVESEDFFSDDESLIGDRKKLFEKWWDSELRDFAVSQGFPENSDDLEGDQWNVIWDYILDRQVKKYIESNYEEVVAQYLDINRFGPTEIYRMMLLPPDTDPTTLENVGQYWAVDRNGADVYWWPDDQKSKVYFLFVADAPEQGYGLDWKTTLCNRLIPGQGESETEMNFRPGAEIYVRYVEQYSGNGIAIGMGNLVKRWEINDWREA